MTAEATKALAEQIVEGVVPAVTKGVAEHLTAAINAAFPEEEEVAEGDGVTASMDVLADQDDASGLDLLAFQTASLHPPLRKVVSDVDAHVGAQPLS